MQDPGDVNRDTEMGPCYESAMRSSVRNIATEILDDVDTLSEVVVEHQLEVDLESRLAISCLYHRVSGLYDLVTAQNKKEAAERRLRATQPG